MDIASVGGVQSPSSLSADSRATAYAAANDLPADQVVIPTASSQSSADAGGDGSRSGSWSERRVTIDPGTQELITQTIDTLTAQVVVQTPDKARLGMRAYIDEVTRRQQDTGTSGAASRLLPALMI